MTAAHLQNPQILGKPSLRHTEENKIFMGDGYCISDNPCVDMFWCILSNGSVCIIGSRLLFEEDPFKNDEIRDVRSLFVLLVCLFYQRLHSSYRLLRHLKPCAFNLDDSREIARSLVYNSKTRKHAKIKL